MMTLRRSLGSLNSPFYRLFLGKSRLNPISPYFSINLCPILKKGNVRGCENLKIEDCLSTY